MIKLIFLLAATGLVAGDITKVTITLPVKKYVTGCAYVATCDTKPGTGTISYKWFKGANGDELMGSESGKTYEIPDGAGASNKYVCKASEGSTTDMASDPQDKLAYVANTEEAVKPTVVVPKDIKAGAEVTLTCQSPAECTGMTYEWFKGKSTDAVKDKNNAAVKTKTLTITAPAAGTSEKYKCKSVIGAAKGESAQVDVPPSSFGTKATYSMMVLVLAAFTGFLMKM